MAPCCLLDYKLINLSALYEKSNFSTYQKKKRIAVSKQNKMSLFFKTGCPRAVPLQGFMV